MLKRRRLIAFAGLILWTLASSVQAQPVTANKGASLPSAPVAAHPLQGCTPSAAEHDHMIYLDVAKFDRSDDGWRTYETAHCYSEAGSLIRDFLASHSALKPDDKALLHFHAGQMLADANRMDDAINEMAEVLGIDPERPAPDPAWTLYVKGSIAFLRQDRPLLDQAAKDLDAQAARESGAIQAGDRLNLNALHGLQKCFGRGYAYAYGSPDCRDFDEAAKLNQVLDAAS
jgi:hypothetical protein